MTAEDLKCPKCHKQALYARIDGSTRCARCGHIVPAMIPPKSVEDEIPSNTGETVLSG